jgi:predicted ATP-binding protein involved in virulence
VTASLTTENYLKISIVNVGPVRRAEIELKDLVIFVGPNNSGKSFIATIMYASLSQTGVATSVRLARSVRRSKISNAEDMEAELATYLAEAPSVSAAQSTNSMPIGPREHLEGLIKESLLEYAATAAQQPHGWPQQLHTRESNLCSTVLAGNANEVGGS